MMKSRFCFVFCGFLFSVLLPFVATAALAGSEKSVAACREVKIAVDRLPDLNIPRSDHHALIVDGCPMVFGGHTSGFVPTATAEIYADGQWQVVPMVYPHDLALCVPLRSGRVLLAGGHEQPLGIGQTFTLELYDPATRSFQGCGCLDTKRTYAEGTELADGRVIIAGNWYHGDAIECFDGTRQNAFVASVSQERSGPYVFAVSDSDAVVFSGWDTRGNLLDTIVADRLRGEPLRMALFDEWRPALSAGHRHAYQGFIGDEAKGDYTYLFLVFNRVDGRMAIARMQGTDLALLPTRQAVPMRSSFGSIFWHPALLTDRKARRAYVAGCDASRRFYVLSVDYAREPAELTLFYTDALDSIQSIDVPLLTPEGDLLLTGGANGNNFAPFASVLLLRLGGSPACTVPALSRWLPWLLALLVAVIVVVALVLHRRRVRNDEVLELNSAGPEDTQPLPDETNDLMARICQLMDEEKLFLNTELKVADVAVQLGVGSRTVSDCIKQSRGISFSQYVNLCRVDYAKHLLLSKPGIKVTAVCMQSGFANETSFFRTFKSITGMTPREWIAQEA